MVSGRRFAKWIAVSSAQQATDDKISPAEQSRLCDEHIARWGGECVAVMNVAESRSIVLLSDAAAKIPAYAQLLDVIKRRACDVLICYDLSRLGRKTSLILSITELCDEYGILVYEVENPPASLDDPYSYSDRIVHAVQASGYQHEIDKLKERLAYGRAGRVKAGNMPSGRPPYGYTARASIKGTATVRTVHVNPEQAAVVRRIIASYLDGAGLGTIANELNGGGIPASGGGVWTHTKVGQLLARIWRYAGYSEITVKTKRGKDYVKSPGKWEPIVSEDVARAVIAERAARYSNRRIANARGRLTGVVWCKRCRHSMSQALAAVEKSGRQRWERFYCAYHLGHRHAVATAAVMDALRLALDALVSADLSTLDTGDNSAMLAALAEDIAGHEANIRRHRANVTRAQTFAVEGLLSADDLRAQLERLNAAIDAERAEIAKLQEQQQAQAAQGTRLERLEEIRARGYEMLATDNLAIANVWWRKYCRVVTDRNRILDVVWL